ncbi:hypothetical protein ACFE04_006167 [Oxalis oulophora]
MEPPVGFLATLWNFICFLPYFLGLLLLGIIKGAIFCPLICLIITIGNSAVILGLWPAHCAWTYYCIVRANKLGPILKLVLCICVLPALLLLWPLVGIAGSVIGGAAYGFLSPIFATFDAVGEGKSNTFSHCVYDGTWSTVKGSFTTVRDVRDVLFHSYFSIMDDLREKGPPDGKYYEIRLILLHKALIAGVLGVIVDVLMISLIALYKSPYMLFKGWHRLFHDLIGREGPFLETICVPFAGLAILLWPLAVGGSVLGSAAASIFLGAYAGIIAYQESSLRFGLNYIIASLSIYDEYSNDVLDMREGSCFPRPRYQRNMDDPSLAGSYATSKPGSFKNPPSRTSSLNGQMIDLSPLDMLHNLFQESLLRGETLISKGLITSKDIEEAKSAKGSTVISTGLPAHCLLQALIRSANANSQGILLADNRELTSTNRPKDTFYDWFLNPFLIMKDQIKAENLSEAEEDYLGKLVLLCGDPARLKETNIGTPPESERRQAELGALARRLQGITKSMSRYPTFRRHFEDLVKNLSEDLAKKNGGSTRNGSQPFQRSQSAFARMFSQKSFKRKTSNNASDDQESENMRDVEIA